MGTKRFATCLVLLAVLTIGCAVPPPTPARLYNLENGDVIQAQMGYADSGHGSMVATLPTGEKCTGEYTIAGRGRSYGPGQYENPVPEDREPPQTGTIKGEDLTWAEAYGYGPNTHVQPIGSATLVGDRGTVLELVIYTFYYYHGVHGDGVGRDNHGNWYRIHIGKVSA
jgi:hypothetical protein